MPCGEREMPGNEREMTPPGVGGEHSFRRLQPTVSTDLRAGSPRHLASRALLASAKTAHTAQTPKHDAQGGPLPPVGTHFALSCRTGILLKD